MADLTQEQYLQLRKVLDESVRPLFFFNDDADGAASYLTLSRYKRDGKGVVVKSLPRITEKQLSAVMEYHPDVIFLLDLSDADEEFIHGAKTPIYMIDHHNPISKPGIQYFNPRLNGNDEPVCTSQMCYGIVGRGNVDEWIPLVGIIGDWLYPDFVKEFSQKHPDLLPPTITTAKDALFCSPFGEIVKLVSFALKGKISDTYESLRALHKIKDPWDLLHQKSPEARFIWRKTQRVTATYNDLFSQAVARGPKGPFVEFIYTEDYLSVTKELSNRLLHHFPDKIILVGREKSGEIKLSLRSRDLIIPPLLEQSLGGVRGYGGGHEHACGANIDAADYPVFIERFKALAMQKLG